MWRRGGLIFLASGMSITLICPMSRKTMYTGSGARRGLVWPDVRLHFARLPRWRNCGPFKRCWRWIFRLRAGHRGRRKRLTTGRAGPMARSDAEIRRTGTRAISAGGAKRLRAKVEQSAINVTGRRKHTDSRRMLEAVALKIKPDGVDGSCSNRRCNAPYCSCHELLRKGATQCKLQQLV